MTTPAVILVKGQTLQEGTINPVLYPAEKEQNGGRYMFGGNYAANHSGLLSSAIRELYSDDPEIKADHPLLKIDVVKIHDRMED